MDRASTRTLQLRAATDEPRPLGDTGYELFEVIGQGGLGVVYRGQDPQGQPVAVKLLERRATRVDAYAPERFRCEGELMAGLDSPHIVRVVDHDETKEGLPYLVMELLAGEDLEDRLERVGRLTTGQVISLGLQLCSALEAAHRQGIVHGDIKPGNIFLCDDRDEPDYGMLIDFGASPVPLGPGDDGEATLIGTPEYIAPEQVDARLGPLGPAADLYALGAVLFRCLTGQLPFHGEPLSQLFQRIHDDAPPLRNLVPEIAPELAVAIDRALARQPQERFASARDLAAALEQASSKEAKRWQHAA